MKLAGWPGWNDERLQPWISRIQPIDAGYRNIHLYAERRAFYLNTARVISVT